MIEILIDKRRLISIPTLYTHKMVMAPISTFGMIIGSIVYRYHLVLGEHQNSHFEPIKTHKYLLLLYAMAWFLRSSAACSFLVWLGFQMVQSICGAAWF